MRFLPKAQKSKEKYCDCIGLFQTGIPHAAVVHDYRRQAVSLILEKELYMGICR